MHTFSLAFVQIVKVISISGIERKLLLVRVFRAIIAVNGNSFGFWKMIF